MDSELGLQDPEVLREQLRRIRIGRAVGDPTPFVPDDEIEYQNLSERLLLENELLRKDKCSLALANK